MVSIASAGEINLDGKYIAINGDDIWHEYQRHTDEAVETGRNQVPFTVETVALKVVGSTPIIHPIKPQIFCGFLFFL